MNGHPGALGDGLTPAGTVVAERLAPAADPRHRLRQHFDTVRAATLALAAPLSAEDQQVQSMPLASPTKWHLGHTAWFFDAMVLAPRSAMVADDSLRWLLNSYYHSLGGRQAQDTRGLMTRPSLDQVLAYRASVDAAVRALIDRAGADEWPKLATILELGLHHEQQHQELIVMDIKHLLSCNPAWPAYAGNDLRLPTATAPDPVPGAAPATQADADDNVDIDIDDGDDGVPNAAKPGLASVDTGAAAGSARASAMARNGAGGLARVLADPVPRWLDIEGGLYWIGADEDGFAYDNERPRHRVWLQPFRLQDRLVTCGQWLAFIADGGYHTPTLWLSDGWDLVQRERWTRPLYWHQDGECEFTLSGWRPRDPHAPACHLSHYEADAYARWAGARLPTEAEWEASAAACPIEGNFADADAPLHPCAPRGPAEADTPQGMFGDTWEWTASAYAAYPGFRPLPGTLGEYNGKFMSGQMVLRGSSSATAPGHARPSYRNFFPPAARWQFSGLRLARDA